MKTTHLAVVILAAGKGTRMKSDLPKVLHPLAGKPMLWHVLKATQGLKPAHTVVITGHGAEAVEAAVSGEFDGLSFARQTEQKGTGHAVQQAEAALKGFTGNVLIVCGDVPLVRTEALQAFAESHIAAGNAVSVASAVVDDPTGLGRMIRDEQGKLQAIREHKDCTPAEVAICESNTGIYAVQAAHLFALLAKVTPNNTQKELYLTDIIAHGLAAGLKVDALNIPQAATELGGVNTKVQLAASETVIQNRLRTFHMLNGVTLQDPATTYFSTDTQIGADVVVGPGAVFGPRVVVASGTHILPHCVLEDCTVGADSRIGPFARLRPGTKLDSHVHIGNFVEVKNSVVGHGTKANHLTYLGDANIGADVNVGAGTITANYNRKTGKKSRTTIGNGSSIGAHTTLVAPVKLGNVATTGAGTTVRSDVADNALAVTKTEILVKPNYDKRS